MGLFSCVSHLICTHTIHNTNPYVERERRKRKERRRRESLERVQPKLYKAIASPSSLKKGEKLALYICIFVCIG